MGVHPSRQGFLVDLRRADGVRDDRPKGTPERRELMVPAKMHRHDAQPQRVVRSHTAWPTSGAGQPRIDETWLDIQAETTAQVFGALVIYPPAIQAGPVTRGSA